MDQEIIYIVNKSFKEADRALVISELSTLKLSHVWESQHNLNATLKAILKLSVKGVEDVSYYTKCARVDFRDVIMWASEGNK